MDYAYLYAEHNSIAMKYNNRQEAYENLVEKRFNIYNGLFLSLPFEGVATTGLSIPTLHTACEEGMSQGKSPEQIINSYFERTAGLQKEEDQLAYLFQVIQYIERQVVLFDSIEDAAFPVVSGLGTNYSLGEFFKYIDKTDLRDEVKEKLRDFSVRIVLTAHPTQFYPPEVLDIIADLRSLIKDNDIGQIDQRLQQLGLTSFIKKQKPTPLEEAQNIIYFLRNIYYDAIGNFYHELKYDLLQDESFTNPDIIKIGFWPGGDRDGNPFVTADTTKQVADSLRMTLMKCYYNDIKELEKRLTFRDLLPLMKETKARIYTAMFDAEATVSYSYLVEQLTAMRSLLVEKYNNLYLDELDRLLGKVHLFKTHFATLDIRQDHRKHKATVEAILQSAGQLSGSIDDLSVTELHTLLEADISDLNPDSFADATTADTIRNIQQLAHVQAANGEAGCNRYIISNSEDIFSVLFVFTLFKWCGWKEESITFDIVPLFETMEGMKNSEAVMTDLYALDYYRAHMSRRGDRQTIMLGFSDGTKDGGYLKANWEIFNTKEVLTKVCNDHNIKAIFFDGRGGPPARGGGKTHRFYASLGDTIANNEIQLTVQGQTITSTFGSTEQFTFNSEQMLTAGIRNAFGPTKNSTISPSDRALIAELAALSFAKYDALKQHPKFISYLENMSTLKYYSNANIGSRPGKRGNTKELTLDDLRAISFVGSWSQLKQNVPGYFGIGTALQDLVEQGRLEDLQRLYSEVPFFKALMLNSMMSLTKSYFPLTSYMKNDSEYGAFWNILHEEYKLSKELMLQISGYDRLMQEEPISHASIKVRERIVLPLLTIQQYALQQVGKGKHNEEVYKKIVTRSLYGNINASRNSA